MTDFERLNKEKIRELKGKPIDDTFRFSKVYHMPILSLYYFDKFYPIVTWNGKIITQQEINQYLPDGYSTYDEAYNALQEIVFDSFDNGICVYDGDEWLRIDDIDLRKNIVVARSIP